MILIIMYIYSLYGFAEVFKNLANTDLKIILFGPSK